MSQKMFCFQCEQTAGCTGCTGSAGVCGKTAEVAKLQDELTGALIGLARAADTAPDVNEGTWRLMVEGLFAAVTNVNFNETSIRELIKRVHAEKARLVPNCAGCMASCGRTDDYDMRLLWNEQEDIRSLKSLILFGVRGMAAYAHHAMVLGCSDESLNRFFSKALFAIGVDWGVEDTEELLSIVMEVGEKNLKCMALLDRANTEMTHIGEDKDFTPLIEKALALGGYPEDKNFTGINGGSTVMTGFAHGTVLGVADQVIEAVKSGAIRHFFLVAGCDGARPGRNYYTEFVKQTPADTVVLTLACGKYRFNDLDLGTIGGLPRLMDVGQCNDAYSAIQIALALADAFGCGVNDLPLSMVLSWYEQKAVCILLTLLHLGIKNIRLGPTLPAFISPNVLNYLVENFGIAPISTPEEDLQQLLK